MAFAGSSPNWDRVWRRRLSRRRLLSAATTTATALAAGTLVGCRPDAVSPTPSPSALRTVADDGHVPVSANGRGGVLRLPGFEAFIGDTLDPHQTHFGPVYSSHSAVFSKVLRYEDATKGIIATDLAESIPESPDGLEFIIRLRKGVRFHRRSAVLGRPASRQERAVDGRELTAEDLVYSFQRQVNESSPRRRFFYRSYQYEVIDRWEVVDSHTVRVVLKEPLALMLHYLADTNAFVIARELVDNGDTMDSQEAMIGTGPFIWDRLQPLQESRFVRNPEWFGWGEPELERPYIDGYRSIFIAADAPLEATFRRKQMDAALQVSNPGWVRKVREEFPELLTRDVGFAAWLNSRFVVDRPPFNDLRVRKAIHLAADRRQIIDALFQGSARMQGPISPVLSRWALPEEELLSMPGYRADPALREQDIREARQMYEQAGSPPIHMTFADQPDYVPSYAEQFRRQLESALGGKVTTEIRGYIQISEGTARGDMAMTWQYDNGWIDPDEWLYAFFHSRGTKNSFRYGDAQLDALLEAQRREFDEERREQRVREIQRHLLKNVLARVDYVTPINLWVAWPYYRNFVPSPFFGESFKLSQAWIDRDNPAYEGRPD